MLGLSLGLIKQKVEIRNSEPTDITLSASAINENNSINDVVGTFTTTDADIDDTFTYALVSGAGSTDNSSFTIVDDELRAAEVFNYEAKSSYAIRVRSTDSHGATFEKQFTISVNNVNEAPTDITLSSSSIDENNEINDVIGTFTTTDPDTGNTFTYTLVSGTGDTDNSSFNISGSNLRASEVFDYEMKSSYSIRVQATDQNNETFEKEFTITINNVGEGSPISFISDNYTEGDPGITSHIWELTYAEGSTGSFNLELTWEGGGGTASNIPADVDESTLISMLNTAWGTSQISPYSNLTVDGGIVTIHLDLDSTLVPLGATHVATIN